LNEVTEDNDELETEISDDMTAEQKIKVLEAALNAAKRKLAEEKR
jgi:hypothetical protein